MIPRQFHSSSDSSSINAQCPDYPHSGKNAFQFLYDLVPDFDRDLRQLRAIHGIMEIPSFVIPVTGIPHLNVLPDEYVEDQFEALATGTQNGTGHTPDVVNFIRSIWPAHRRRCGVTGSWTTEPVGYRSLDFPNYPPVAC